MRRALRAARTRFAAVGRVVREGARRVGRLFIRVETVSVTVSVLSAIAAVCSATAAVIAFAIQDQNVTNAVRPELSLTAWRSASNDKGGEFNIGMIENVGQGPAFTIIRDLRVAGRDDDPNCAFLPTEVVMLLPKGERRPIDWHGRFSWKCGTPGADTIVLLRLTMQYYDLNENFHTRVLHLIATKSGQWAEAVGAELLAPGLSWSRTCSEIRGARFWNRILPPSGRVCRD